MKWSWSIGRISGIALRIHATFLLLLAWLVVVQYRSAAGLRGGVAVVAFAATFVLSVLMHEIGHALAARRMGVATRDITLLPTGGIARVDFMPDDPREELWIALAGPAVTLAIVLACAALLGAAGWPLAMADDPSSYGLGQFLVQAMWVNAALLAFNLLPAYPMDGGRALRALLALRMDRARAANLTVRVGHVFALVCGVVGLLYAPLLVLIALVIWISAAAEAGELHERTALAGVRVSRAMVSDVRSLDSEDTLNDAMRHVLGGFQRDIPVLSAGKVVGLLTHARLVAGLARDGVHAPASAWMDSGFRTVDPSEPLATAFARFRDCRCATLIVVTDDHLCGLLTMEHVADYLVIDAALRGPLAASRRRALRRLSPSVIPPR